MADLKLCPFCGRIPMVEDCGANRYFVRCKCGIAQDKLYAQRCDAVRRWNTRKPSAQPEQKTGRWAWDIESATFICTNCNSGYKDQPTIMGKPLFEYCPICGAKVDEVRAWDD